MPEFMGSGQLRDEKPNVHFLPRQQMSEMGGFLGAADAFVVHLKDDPLFQITVPSKTQAYLAAGKPILMAVRGNVAMLIKNSGGDNVCEPDKVATIAAAVAGAPGLAAATPDRLMAMGRAAREFYDRELSLSAGAEAFEGVFSEALK